jgi:hypothetical protein
MALFDEKMTQPVILKEDSSLEEQLKQLTEFLQKPLSADVRDQVENDIRCIKAGINGENKLLFELKNSHIPMFVLRDLYIADGDLSAQIDFIVITRKLFFVIECKNLYGNIEIDSDGNFIRTVWYGKYFKKEGIYSPITQNERHMELIRKIRRKNKGFLMRMIFQHYAFQKFYRSLVVLTNEDTVLNDKNAPKEVREKVIRADKLIEYIKKEIATSIDFNSSEVEMRGYAKNFLEMHRKQDIDYTQKYFGKATADKAVDTYIPNPLLSMNSSQAKQNGYCIRTGVEIPFDIEKPLSLEAYKKWKKFGNKNYPEKFCHFSGEPSNGETSFNEPILKKNREKAKK